MGFLDRLKQQANTAAGKHGDKIVGGLDKAGDAVNKRTGGKYAAHVTKAKTAAKNGIDKAGRSDGTGGAGTPGTPGGPR